MTNNKKIIYNLPEEVLGTGEVEGILFRKVYENEFVYIYSAIDPENTTPYYEVFERQIVPICLDFDKRVYSETEFKERYPKSNDFGLWAFTFIDYNKAKDRFDKLTLQCKLKKLKKESNDNNETNS